MIVWRYQITMLRLCPNIPIIRWSRICFICHKLPLRQRQARWKRHRYDSFSVCASVNNRNTTPAQCFEKNAWSHFIAILQEMYWQKLNKKQMQKKSEVIWAGVMATTNNIKWWTGKPLAAPRPVSDAPQTPSDGAVTGPADVHALSFVSVKNYNARTQAPPTRKASGSGLYLIHTNKFDSIGI